MLLFEMLTNYIFLTTPVLSLNALLIPLQIIFQLFTPVFIMINVIRRRTMTERILLIAMPVACCLTAILMNILLGGSFLNGGFSYEPQLIQYILHSGVTDEIWAVIFLFIASYFTIEIILHRRTNRPSKKIMLLNLPGTILNFCLLFVCLLTVIYIQKTGNFPSVLQVSENPLIDNLLIDSSLVLYFTYAVYNLVFQTFVNILALLMHILFSGKELSGDIRLLSANPDWCDYAVKRFFTDGYKVMFYSFVQFAVLFYALMYWAILDEGFSVSLVLWFHVFLAPLDLLVTYSLFRILFPASLPVLRKMELWGNPQQIKRQFCLEFLDSKFLPIKGMLVWTTPYFILTPVSFFKRLYYIPAFQEIKGQRMIFKDGSHIKMQNLQPLDRSFIQSAVQDFR